MKNAYAKINIGLLVGGKRPDGFHEIDSYFHLIGLHDEIGIDFLPSEDLVVEIEGSESYLTPGAEDLMAKALRLFSEKSWMCFKARIRIIKHIPSKAGLGGGSSDAALVLKEANEYYDNPLSPDELMEVAAEVGSDVPFFITGWPCAHVTGRGEVLEKADGLTGPIDVFMPSWSVETKGAYAKLDSMERKERKLPKLSGIPSNEVFVNDFELVSPRSEAMNELAKEYDYFTMSGSGSSYVGISGASKSTNDAEKLAISAEIALFNTFLVSFS